MSIHKGLSERFPYQLGEAVVKKFPLYKLWQRMEQLRVQVHHVRVRVNRLHPVLLLEEVPEDRRMIGFLIFFTSTINLSLISGLLKVVKSMQEPC